jgi:hypothetical protein
MKLSAAIPTLSLVASAQTVVMPWEIPCAEETVRVESGALRRYNTKSKFVAYRMITTDKEGHFDFGLVDRGEYQFLPAPSGARKQPSEVTCPGNRDCEINLVLQVNPSDQPFASSPIQ